MPVYEVSIPNGGKYRIESQQELGDEQVFRMASQQADMERMADPITDMSHLDRFNAGVGKAFSDIGRGTAQLVGQGPSAQETAETRLLDAPLMRTGAGVAGNIAGNMAAFAPMAVIPGANTVAGATALGATAAALQPAKSAPERILNMGEGGILGGGTQAVAGPVAQRVGEWGAARQARKAQQQSQNAVRDQTLRDAQEAGYVVPPSAVNPSWLNKRLESVAGKAAVGQQASISNQQRVNVGANRELGIPEGTALTEDLLGGYRQGVSQPYRDVAGLSPHAQNMLEQLKQARADATAYFRHYERSADPASLRQAQASRQAADQAEQILETEARQANRPDLIDALRASRTQIAKSYEVERALNVGSGDVSARTLGRSLDRGRPLTGELATAGRFAEAFPMYAREASSVPTPGVSKSEALASALLGLGGSAATGSPFGAIAGALPLLSGPTRSMLLSRPYQRMMARPNYSPGVTANAAAALDNPETRRRAAMLARALALPSIPQAVNQ